MIVGFILLFATTALAEQVQTSIPTKTPKDKQFAIVAKGKINKKS